MLRKISLHDRRRWRRWKASTPPATRSRSLSGKSPTSPAAEFSPMALSRLLPPGPEGLVNPADDVVFPATGVCPAGPECLALPGPDGILGTADDKPLSLANFTRQIQINTVLEADGVTIDPNLKQITVTVSFTTGGSPVPRTYTVNALISAFR